MIFWSFNFVTAEKCYIRSLSCWFHYSRSIIYIYIRPTSGTELLLPKLVDVRYWIRTQRGRRTNHSEVSLVFSQSPISMFKYESGTLRNIPAVDSPCPLLGPIPIMLIFSRTNITYQPYFYIILEIKEYSYKKHIGI